MDNAACVKKEDDDVKFEEKGKLRGDFLFILIIVLTL